MDWSASGRPRDPPPSRARARGPPGPAGSAGNGAAPGRRGPAREGSTPKTPPEWWTASYPETLKDGETGPSEVTPHPRKTETLIGIERLEASAQSWKISIQEGSAQKSKMTN